MTLQQAMLAAGCCGLTDLPLIAAAMERAIPYKGYWIIVGMTATQQWRKLSITLSAICTTYAFLETVNHLWTINSTALDELTDEEMRYMESLDWKPYTAEELTNCNKAACAAARKEET